MPGGTLVFTLLLAFALAEEPADPGSQLWAGEQVTRSVRSVPLLGDVETTTTTRTLARVVEKDGHVVIVDRPCSIEVKNTGGVELVFAVDAVRRMPPVTSRFSLVDGAWAAAWRAGWGVEDVDGDGQPGVAVRVKAPVCGGSLDVASRTTTKAVAQRVGGGLSGKVDVQIARDIVQASNPCLKLVNRHQDESVAGTFAFVPIDADATCESLAEGDWPASAPTE